MVTRNYFMRECAVILFFIMHSFVLFANEELKDALLEQNWREAKKLIDADTFNPDIKMFSSGSKFAGTNALHFVARHQQTELLFLMLQKIESKKLFVDINSAPQQGPEEGKTALWYLSVMKSFPFETIKRILTMFPEADINKAPTTGVNAGHSVLWNLTQEDVRNSNRGHWIIVKQINDQFPNADFNAGPGDGQTVFRRIIAERDQQMVNEILSKDRGYHSNVPLPYQQASTPLIMVARNGWWPAVKRMIALMKKFYPNDSLLDWQVLVNEATKANQWDIVEEVAEFLSEEDVTQATVEKVNFLPFVSANKFTLAFKLLPKLPSYQTPTTYFSGMDSLTEQQLKIYSLIYFYLYPREIVAQELKIHDVRALNLFTNMKTLFFAALDKHSEVSNQLYCDSVCEQTIYDFVVGSDADLKVMKQDEMVNVMKAFKMSLHEKRVSEKANYIVTQVLSRRGISEEQAPTPSYEHQPIPFQEIKNTLLKDVEDEIRRGIRLVSMETNMPWLIAGLESAKILNHATVQKLFQEIFAD